MISRYSEIIGYWRTALKMNENASKSPFNQPEEKG
jgi:hypothetical protein